MKTGYTETAGYCLIASSQARAAPAAVGGAGHELGVGARAESQKLLNYGFQFFDTVQLYEKDQPVSADQGLERRDANQLKAGFPYDLF